MGHPPGVEDVPRVGEGDVRTPRGVLPGETVKDLGFSVV